MTIRATRRELAIEAMADYLLAHGLEAATLRQLAEAAGTSDRMLLYYFTDRDELLSATLERIAARLAAKLDAIIPPGERLGQNVIDIEGLSKSYGDRVLIALISHAPCVECRVGRHRRRP